MTTYTTDSLTAPGRSSLPIHNCWFAYGPAGTVIRSSVDVTTQFVNNTSTYIHGIKMSGLLYQIENLLASNNNLHPLELLLRYCE
jgi:hypothetical protein